MAHSAFFSLASHRPPAVITSDLAHACICIKKSILHQSDRKPGKLIADVLDKVGGIEVEVTAECVSSIVLLITPPVTVRTLVKEKSRVITKTAR